jgi:hypothetical protein
MTPLVTGLLFVVVLLALLAIGMPIAFALGFVSEFCRTVLPDSAAAAPCPGRSRPTAREVEPVVGCAVTPIASAGAAMMSANCENACQGARCRDKIAGIGHAAAPSQGLPFDGQC